MSRPPSRTPGRTPRPHERYIDVLDQALVRQGYTQTRAFARAVIAALYRLVLQQLDVAEPNAVCEAIARIGLPLAAASGR